MTSVLDRFGLTDFAALQERLSKALAAGGKAIAGQVLAFGQNTLEFVLAFFVMLYVLFFLLRDGDALVQRMREAVPLTPARREALFNKFTVVVRASVKGNVVSRSCRALGGLIFWTHGHQRPVLWAVVMAILSLLRRSARGASSAGPVALYFLATGAIVKGLVSVDYGVLVMGWWTTWCGRCSSQGHAHPDYVILVARLAGSQASA